MEAKEFHLGLILTVITGRMVAPRGIEDLCEIFEFLTGHPDNWRNQELGDGCQTYLQQQFPQFTSNEMELAVADLVRRINLQIVCDSEDRERFKKIADDWLAKQVVHYGEKFAVQPMTRR